MTGPKLGGPSILGSVCANAQQQLCPTAANSSFCEDQLADCPNVNEGKNCFFTGCYAYCDNEYQQCLYGILQSSNVTYPIVSTTALHCITGCSGSWTTCYVTNLFAEGVWDGYMKHLTDYLEMHTDHYVCPNDSYEYDSTFSIAHQDNCYRYDRDCAGAEYLGSIHWEHINNACFIDPTFSYVQFSP